MILAALQNRSEHKCELCSNPKSLNIHIVAPETREALEYATLICETCQLQITNPEEADPNHWRCLNDSVWNPEPAVQVLAWRMLKHLKNQDWTRDLLDMMYIEDDTLAWAKRGYQDLDTIVKHRDSNGTILEAGDDVSLIKDLDVKGGGNFTAKRGTVVRRISLVHDNPEHIEGKVEGVHLVILTKFVKKSN
ncbi:PhnA protein [Dokdonia sinensis]|uniref:PhnA protein n=1 Tax=Dokdonia sinensis TaxID=2479847 RepID=A0A3M0FXH0_9FLAO|nr:alkylphosphonate utilization protein [Dokdonia sinensis]RMB57401.1 PhnA protein [Dokdonia sinensis]